MSDIHTVGLDLFSFSNNGMRKPVSRITLYVNNEDDQVYTAGDDTGLELSATCIYATEEMAKTLLSMAKGAQYQMYEAQAANLDPAAELGDGIEVGGITSVIAQINDNGDGYPDVSASGEQEVEDEYPGASRQGPIQRELARARSLISKTNDRISMEIYGEDGKGGLNGRMNTFTMGLSGISNEIKGYKDTLTGYEEQLARYEQDLDGYSGEVSKYTKEVNGYKEQTISYKGSVDGFEQRVALYQEQAQKTQEAYSTISQKVDNIAIKIVNPDGTETSVKLSDGKVDLTGLVTFSSLSSAPGNGVTKINGGWIDADTLTVKAARIDGTIQAKNLNLSGMISFSDLTDSDDIQQQISDAAESGGLSKTEVKTIITDELVASPMIKGGKFRDLNNVGELRLTYDKDDEIPSLVFSERALGGRKNMFAIAPFNVESEWIGLVLGGQAIMLGYNGSVQAFGNWDFSKANVIWE